MNTDEMAKLIGDTVITKYNERYDPYTMTTSGCKTNLRMALSDWVLLRNGPVSIDSGGGFVGEATVEKMLRAIAEEVLMRT